MANGDMKNEMCVLTSAAHILKNWHDTEKINMALCKG